MGEIYERNKRLHVAFRDTMAIAQKNHLYTESKVTELEMLHSTIDLAEYTKDSLAMSMLEGIKDKLTITETEDVLTHTYNYKADVYVFSEDELIRLLSEHRTRIEDVFL